MTLPREVIPGRFYMVTRRCTQRQFLLRPDAETNNAFIYCLAVAAARCDVEVILPSAMANHHHTVIFDRYGNVPRFTEHFHKLLAKTQNALRGRWENFWASEQVSVVRLVDGVDVLRKVVYAAMNAVTANLVDKVHHWPGVNGLAALLNGRVLHARRPSHFFRADGDMPTEITLELSLPPELGDPRRFLTELREQIAVAEAAAATRRRRAGEQVLGRRAVKAQSWRSGPRSVAERRRLRPTIAALDKLSRVDALLQAREFVAAYRAARQGWLAGMVATFPAGTYWLRRFAGVRLVS